MTCKKVWFYIHNFPLAKTLRVAKHFLKKYKFIKCVIEDDKCILICHDMGKYPSSWIINKCISMKSFIGKYHRKHPLYNSKRNAKTVDRYQAAACRFGYFDIYDWPNDKQHANFILTKLKKQLEGKPFYQAEHEAAAECNHKLNQESSHKYIKRYEYIKDLVNFFGHTEESATQLIDKELPSYKDAQPKPPMTKAQRDKKISSEKVKIDELIGKLLLMSPKHRKKYLNDDENMGDFIRFIFIVKTRGVEWVKNNIGSIPGIVD